MYAGAEGARAVCAYHAAVATRSPLRQALASREIRLAELAWMLGLTAETSYAVTLLVSAYERGGIVQVGVVGVARTLPAGVLAPFIAGLAGRLARHRVLLVAYTLRATAVGLLAVAALLGAPAIVVALIAAVEGVASTLQRPSQMALLPALASEPAELVAANVVSGAAENLGSLVGPALGAVLVASLPIAVAFAVPSLGFAVAAIVIANVHPAGQPPRAESGAPAWRRSLEGLVALNTYRSAALMVGLGLVQVFVRGLLTVMGVAAAVELLGLGEHGFGELQTAIGAGGVIGAVLVGIAAHRIRLSTASLVGLALWGLPILVIGLWPSGIVAILVLTILGIGNATFDVGLFSLLQRNVPNQDRSSVLGAFEGLIGLSVGIGSLLAPAVAHLLGLQGALIATGLILPVLAIVAAPAVRRAEGASIVPEDQMRLLRGTTIFHALPLTVVEHLAGRLVPMVFADGEAACVEGEPSDRFYLIEAGTAVVTVGGTEVARLGAGESFGEIGLLRSVPRTATVRAIGELRTLALGSKDFVAAVTGNPLATSAADALVVLRLADDARRTARPTGGAG